MFIWLFCLFWLFWFGEKKLLLNASDTLSFAFVWLGVCIVANRIRLSPGDLLRCFHNLLSAYNKTVCLGWSAHVFEGLPKPLLLAAPGPSKVPPQPRWSEQPLHSPHRPGRCTQRTGAQRFVQRGANHDEVIGWEGARGEPKSKLEPKWLTNKGWLYKVVCPHIHHLLPPLVISCSILSINQFAFSGKKSKKNRLTCQYQTHKKCKTALSHSDRIRSQQLQQIEDLKRHVRLVFVHLPRLQTSTSLHLCQARRTGWNPILTYGSNVCPFWRREDSTNIVNIISVQPLFWEMLDSVGWCWSFFQLGLYGPTVTPLWHPTSASKIEGLEEFLDVCEARIVLENLCFPGDGGCGSSREPIGKMQKMHVETTVMVTSLEICKHMCLTGALWLPTYWGVQRSMPTYSSFLEFPRPMSDGQGGSQGLYLGLGGRLATIDYWPTTHL